MLALESKNDTNTSPEVLLVNVSRSSSRAMRPTATEPPVSAAIMCECHARGGIACVTRHFLGGARLAWALSFGRRGFGTIRTKQKTKNGIFRRPPSPTQVACMHACYLAKYDCLYCREYYKIVAEPANINICTCLVERGPPRSTSDLWFVYLLHINEHVVRMINSFYKQWRY